MSEITEIQIKKEKEEEQIKNESEIHPIKIKKDIDSNELQIKKEYELNVNISNDSIIIFISQVFVKHPGKSIVYRIAI
jgi:hypothetical protein